MGLMGKKDSEGAGVIVLVSGVALGLQCILTAEVCLAVVHIVRNSFRACEILERIESNTKRN